MTSLVIQFGSKKMGHTLKAICMSMMVMKWSQSSVTAAKDVTDKKSSMQEMREIYNEHNNGNTPPPTQKM